MVEPTQKQDPNPEIDALSESYSLRDTVQRASLLSFTLAFIFGIYGYSSLDFIHRFDDSVTLWGNTWPRLLVSVIPLGLLGLFLRIGKTGDKAKLTLWIIGFATILHATSWIHIWPIALWKSGLILTYVHPANLWLYAVIFAGVAPPRSMQPRFFLSLGLIFILPLIAVSYLSGDLVVFRMFINDSFLALSFLVLLSRIIDNLRIEVSRSRALNEVHARQFLGPVVADAIFQNQSEKLETVRCRGFLVSIDIRDSTDLQKQHPELWKTFRREYFALVSRLVAAHRGYIQKTVGDCHVINFGVMDFGVDLSDIPGIDNELSRAEERRLQRASDFTFAFLTDLFQQITALAAKYSAHFPVSLGAGVDKGWVERGVQGDSSQALELDVNGDPVNCSNRLQEYSKYLRLKNGWPGSVLVLSPFASDYLKDFESFQRVLTTDAPVRNYPGIRWLLVKHFAAGVEKKEAA